MAFRKKKDRILRYDPDILIIQECENPELKGEWSEFSEWLWVGDNEHKGLGVFSRDGISLESTTIDESDSRYTIPATTDDEVDVLGIWAMNDEQQPKRRYIGQVYTALQEHSGFTDSATVVAGDFNWNRIWDESPNGRLCGDFSDTVGILNDCGLRSVYHTMFGTEFGNEDDSTFSCTKSAIEDTTPTISLPQARESTH